MIDIDAKFNDFMNSQEETLTLEQSNSEYIFIFIHGFATSPTDLLPLIHSFA